MIVTLKKNSKFIQKFKKIHHINTNFNCDQNDNNSNQNEHEQKNSDNNDNEESIFDRENDSQNESQSQSDTTFLAFWESSQKGFQDLFSQTVATRPKSVQEKLFYSSSCGGPSVVCKKIYVYYV